MILVLVALLRHAAEHIGRRVARDLHDRCDRRRRERPVPVLLYRTDRTTRFDADLHARNASKREVSDRRRIARLAQSERSDAQTLRCSARSRAFARLGPSQLVSGGGVLTVRVSVNRRALCAAAHSHGTLYASRMRCRVRFARLRCHGAGPRGGEGLHANERVTAELLFASDIDDVRLAQLRPGIVSQPTRASVAAEVNAMSGGTHMRTALGRREYPLIAPWSGPAPEHARKRTRRHAKGTAIGLVSAAPHLADSDEDRHEARIDRKRIFQLTNVYRPPPLAFARESAACIP